jgi:ribonucleoside-diphosphate reductase alpha chain
MYPDSNDLGELFIRMRKEGEDSLPHHLKNDMYVTDLHRTVSELTAFLRGVLDQLAIAVSVGLQRGIPLEVYASKYKGTRFPPDGRTENHDIPYANSIVDYIFRWLGQKFIGTEEWLPPKRGG